MRAKAALRPNHRLVVDAADQRFGSAPCLVVGLAHDDVQADAELDGTALARRALAHVGDLLRHFGRRLAPGEIGIDLLGGQFVRRFRRATEPHGRIRLLRRREQQLRALHAQMLAVVVEALPFMAARDDLAPDADELGRLLVARGMVEKHAIAFQLGLVAARDEVHQHASAGEPIEGRRHARGKTRLMQARPHRDQELEPRRRADQARRDHPRVFAGAAGGNQHAFVAELVGRAGDLLQVGQVDRARAFGGAEIAAVAVRGEEPEDVHRHVLSRFGGIGVARRCGRLPRAWE